MKYGSVVERIVEQMREERRGDRGGGAKSSCCGVAAWRVARVASSNQVVERTIVHTVAIVLHRRIHL